ncbi:MAG: glycosyltransferase family 1 protein [FCB group bacterium]|nr:glycosyltransferase family 1 protein [FCB group bacterium]
MRAAIVYNKNDHKLQAAAYSWSYRCMFLSLVDRFKQTISINDDCHADAIFADVIIFFDPHSSHHIKIEGIERHPALKIEYFNDPHQKEFYGRYANGDPVHKLSAKQRTRRALERGVEYIISPYKQGYYDYIAKHIIEYDRNPDDILLYFPTAPDASLFESGRTTLAERKPQVLANGATWSSRLKCYELRQWAFGQDCVTTRQHCHRDKNTPKSEAFGSMLAEYAGALALCEFYPVPKYFEIPLAGCVCFAQYHKEYEQLGFIDGETCIYVDKNNFIEHIKAFKSNPSTYQPIADAGRRLMLSKYTSKHFADYVYKFAESAIVAGVK